MLTTLLFLFWESALLLAAGRLIALINAGRGAKCSAEEYFALVLSADMVLESLAGTTLSFASANSPAAYLVIAAILLLFGARPDVFAALWSRWRELQVWRFRLTAAVLCAAVVPVFFLTLKPIDEVDSANYLHFLLEWRAGRATPYTFFVNYVAFGPARFLPTLVLARNDWFFGFVALKPFFLSTATSRSIRREYLLVMKVVISEWSRQ